MIPKIIHYCWFGRNPKPKLAEKCIKSWKKYCPDYEIIEWNEDNYDVTKIPYTKAAYDAKMWGFVTDYARLDIIYNHGGIYLDTDVELLKSYDCFLMYAGFAGFESEKFVNTGLGMGAEEGNSMIRYLMETYQQLNPFQEDGALNFIPCPKLDTPVLVQHGLKLDGSYQMIDDNFAIFPIDFFCPLDPETGLFSKTKNTAAIHHFTASWCAPDVRIKRNAWWRKRRLEHLRYAPNRFIRKVVGNDKIDQLKRFLGK